MKVILLERVGRHGHIGDEVTVKDGYARTSPAQRRPARHGANRKRSEGTHKHGTPNTSAARPPPVSPRASTATPW